MKRSPLVIIDGTRTPFCRFGTQLASFDAEELGRLAVNALLSKTGIDPGCIDETIFGCVGQPAHAPNIARVIAMRSGIPKEKPAATVQRNCASGFEALTQAAEKCAAVSGEIFVVGGTESMSRAPFLIRDQARKKWLNLSRAKRPLEKLTSLARFRPADFAPVPALKLALKDPLCDQSMGETAETLAREFGIDRDEQDAFARQSHARAVQHRDKLGEEIAPLFLDRQTVLQEDNGIRSADQIAKLTSLPPVFDRQDGSITAGNASQVTDGAVALLVASEKAADQLGIEPLGRLIDWQYAGCDPARMGLGPAYAIAQLLDRSAYSLDDFDLYEMNEAFAAQVLAVLKVLQSEPFCRDQFGTAPVGTIPQSHLNVNGGAIAIGHPVGATGARLALTALMELRRKEQCRALVSACIGGGQGVALHLEKA